ncbi:glycosylphosphatidylinositol anchor biosynthesis [Collariella sp. IMI 366227]|nr:glycosylphosphatidylinositol anchor biosynthesis [Collariella sp. IMI 366227]
MDSTPSADLRQRGRNDAGSHGTDEKKKADPATTPAKVQVHAQVAAAQVADVLRLLLAFRFINSLCVRTFFQPDEYFQALEPAWSIAFGENSGAWLTWEWQHQLRSSLHPAIFGLAYKAVDGIMSLTIAALSYWPWELVRHDRESGTKLLSQKGRLARYFSRSHSCWSLTDFSSLRISLVLAAIAVLLRPTNLLIWMAILTASISRVPLNGALSLTVSSVLRLCREIAVCGAVVLAVFLVSDRLYFGFWTFPPYKWLDFNLNQDLAVFYGQMPWHYYLSQGVPLLTTTFLPFALTGLYKAITSTKGLPLLQSNTLKTLAFATLIMLTTLSLISHKEKSTTNPLILRHKLTLAHVLSLNLLLAGYLTLFHQPAPLSVLTFLRSDFERLHPDLLTISLPSTTPSTNNVPNKTSKEENTEEEAELFALFLTPCHTTPWRSHLIYPALRARALTCEPPLHTAPDTPERALYLDEADRFYRKEEDGAMIKAGPGYGVRFLGEEMWPVSTTKGEEGRGEREGEMPRYIVGFEGIEPVEF